MAVKFCVSPVRQRVRDELVDDLRAAKEKLIAALNEYNELVEKAETLREEVADDLDSEIDSRSEKWQDSLKGEAARELQAEWTEVSFDIVDLDPELDHADELEKLNAYPNEVEDE